MKKKDVLNELIKRANEEYQKATNNYEGTKCLAREDDIKAESKWDTRKQEASYLAAAHQKRKEELKLDLKMLKEIELQDFNEGMEAAIGAIVTLELNKICKKYFLSPTFGGQIIGEGKDSVLVISVFSPIGAEIMGLSAGDEFDLETDKGLRKYLIKSIE